MRYTGYRRYFAWLLYVEVVAELDLILKDAAVQGDVPSGSLPSSRALADAAPSSDRSIEVSRPARILDTIDCRHPASRTTARGSFNRPLLLLLLLFLFLFHARAGLTNLSVFAFEPNVCELPPLRLRTSVHFSSRSILRPRVFAHVPRCSRFLRPLSSPSSSFLFLPYQAEGGSGHERAATLLLDSDVVAGAEVRRISIGFEPDADGRPKTP